MYCRTDVCHAHEIMRVSVGSDSSVARQTIQLTAFFTSYEIRNMAVAFALQTHSVGMHGRPGAKAAQQQRQQHRQQCSGVEELPIKNRASQSHNARWPLQSCVYVTMVQYALHTPANKLCAP